MRKSSGIRERRQRLLPPPERALSHNPVRVAIAIDDHHRDEPSAIQSPDNPNPIQLDLVIVGTFIGADPALLIRASHRKSVSSASRNRCARAPPTPWPNSISSPETSAAITRSMTLADATEMG
jgi:hypothetical protein